MKIETKNEKKSMLPLTTYDMKATFKGATPSRKDVKNKVSVLLDAEPESVIVKEMKPGFGKGTLTFKTRVYHDEEAKELLESDGMLQRNTFEQEEEE